LSLDIQKGVIWLAVASHPSFQEPTTVLEPIHVSRRLENLPERLAEIVKEHKVCGFVVNWPVQKDTSKLGYSCGLVLRTLEKVMESSSRPAISSSRPVCLWDQNHVAPSVIDDWGRCADYARTSDKTLHLASRDQYHVESDNNVASQVLEEFMRVNWPTIHEQKVVYAAEQAQKRSSFKNTWQKSNTSSHHWEDDSHVQRVEYA